MRRFATALVTLLALLALRGHARAEVPYELVAETRQFPDSCESAEIDIEGDLFFHVNALGLPTRTLELAEPFGNPRAGYRYSKTHATFGSLLLRRGTNTFGYAIHNSSGDDSCVHAHHVVQLASPVLRAPLVLFDIIRIGRAVNDTVQKDLTLRQVDPDLADAYERIKAEINAAIDYEVQHAADTDANLQRIDELIKAESDLDALLDKPFDEITVAEVDALLDPLYQVGASIKDALDTLIGDFKKDIAGYRDEVNRIISDFQAVANGITDGVVTGPARGGGFDPGNPGNYTPQTDPTQIPPVGVPALDVCDFPHDPYGPNADVVIAKLNATITNGALNDRAAFQQTVASWRDNQNALAEMLKRRAACTKEVGAFLDAQSRVLSVVRKYMDANDWFKDAPIPEQLKQLVDGLKIFHLAWQQHELKGNLNLWVGPQPTPEQQMVIDALNALLDGALRADYEDDPAEDPDYHLAVRQMLDGAVVVVKEVAKFGLYLTPVGPFISLCEVISGHEMCLPSGRQLSTGERVFSAVSITVGPIILAKIGKAVVVGGKFVFNKASAVMGVFSDLVPLERKAVNRRLWAAVSELADLTGKEAKALLAQLAEHPSMGKDGDHIIHDLASALKGKGLQRLAAFEMFPVAGEALQVIKGGGGATVLKLPSLRGKSLSEIESLAKSLKFTPLSNPGTNLQVWIHQDGSLLRVGNSSGNQRFYLQIKKEITRGAGLSNASDVVAKVSDNGFVVPQLMTGPNRDLMNKWLQSIASRPPTVAESEAMQNAWAVLTHIPINP
ncbi:MAG: hypothetical protein JWN44_4615 [Myxococcales bacterium]|nr:hypothetical protein [Myxococcales bacterium]